jgi:hypothetical protein
MLILVPDRNVSVGGNHGRKRKAGMVKACPHRGLLLPGKKRRRAVIVNLIAGKHQLELLLQGLPNVIALPTPDPQCFEESPRVLGIIRIPARTVSIGENLLRWHGRKTLRAKA